MLSRDYKFVQFAVFTHNIWAVDSVCNIYVYIYILCVLACWVAKFQNDIMSAWSENNVVVYLYIKIAILRWYGIIVYLHTDTYLFIKGITLAYMSQKIDVLYMHSMGALCLRKSEIGCVTYVRNQNLKKNS